MSHQAVLDYWFEPGKTKRWFGGGPELDAEIKEKFGTMIQKARDGEYASWENLNDGNDAAFAFVILIDQFCRNVYRGTTDMYSHDPKSLAVALKLIDNGSYKKMNANERFFLYLPLEHNESVEMQAKSVALYSELVEDMKDSDNEMYKKTAQQGLSYAKIHQEQILKYGRFPKRNKILGRENTAQEEEDLKDWKHPF